MRFPVSYDMLDPAPLCCLGDIKTAMEATQLLLLLPWSLMQGPHLFNVLPKTNYSQLTKVVN